MPELLTQHRLQQLLHYDPDTGAFTWKSREYPPAWNANWAGKRAGKVSPKGYVQISVDGRLHYAHRLAWLYMTGSWPLNQIDHIDGNRAANGFANLRDVPGGVNQQNRRGASRANRTTGLLGVSVCAKTGKFRAQIKVDGRSLNLGRHDSPEQAHICYLNAKRESHAGCTI